MRYGFHGVFYGYYFYTNNVSFSFFIVIIIIIIHVCNVFTLQICVVLGAVLGTIVYRISLVAVFYGGGGAFLKRHAKIFTSMTAALINLIIIMILTRIYHRLARWMVNMENPRTQTEYEASYTFKIFLFEFVNFYSSLIYIAFFKVRRSIVRY